MPECFSQRETFNNLDLQVVLNGEHCSAVHFLGERRNTFVVMRWRSRL